MMPLFYPEDASGTGGTPSGEMGKEEVIEFLGDDDDDAKKEVIDLNDKAKEGDEGKKDDKEGKKPKEKEVKEPKDDDDTDDDSDDEEDVKDELSELEEELEPPTEEQLELVTPVKRRDILKKYPALFKEFPYLEKAYYREQQFTELLPTIDDAKEAVEAKKTLDNFEKDLIGGNTEIMLKAIKEQNPNSFKKIVDNYLNTLSKIDEGAYHHVIGNTIRHTIMAMVSEGKRSGNDALVSAAALLNQFSFGSTDFKPPTNLAETKDEKETTKETDLDKERKAFVKQRFEASRDDLNTRVNNSLKNTIAANIDPKSSMTDYVRRNASREALESLETLISKDSRFQSLVDKLWEKAFQSNFDKASTDRIRSAWFSQAKTLLPSVIKKARNEALRGLGKRVKDDDDSNESKKAPVKQQGRPQSQSDNKSGNKKEVPRGMSTLDFLSSD